MSTSGTDAEDLEEGAGASVEANSDPLVSNGLGSPLCKQELGPGALSAGATRDCATSGFVASAAPTANFGLDVHIDSGLLGFNLDSAAQDGFITPVWTALVWVVHAVCVMLEWCFTLDLLDSSAAAGLGGGLREMQSTLTQPWLATVLSIASVAVLYDGLVRRRVAETLGQALLMVTMIAGGMWAIADPTGTVGALARWANQASLGTLAVAARGTPEGPPRALGESMQTVFAAAIEAPWCYLEFGNVSWCRDTRRMDPALRAAGLKIATAELSAAGCKTDATPTSSCTSASGAQAAAVEHSAQLLREAQSNGAIFLALPPNGPARNSINEEGSLLRTLCGSSEATNCRGATAAEAEFRTGGQTLARIAGLLLIVLGALGMILLLGFIALRLLGAALFSLLFLLMAPGMVLAPALGTGGRAVFRKWLMQLLGAVVSKLLFSFLLGVVLAVLAILAALDALGWWTQWLLMSAFWWGAFLRRHHALALAEGAFSGGRSQGPLRVRRSAARRLGDALETRKGWATANWVRSKFAKQGRPDVDPPRDTKPRPSRPSVTARGDAPHEQFPLREHLRESLRDGSGQREGTEQQRRRAQLARVRSAQAKAESAGERRRAAELRSRAERVEAEIARAAQGSAGEGGLDTEARAGAAREARASSAAARETPAGRELEVPDPVRRREARLEIDRELALQRELSEAAGTHAPRGRGRSPREARPSSPDGAAREDTRGADEPARPGESSVMRDAREVEAGRKRQLGTGLP